jgi:hypothetical protein
LAVQLTLALARAAQSAAAQQPVAATQPTPAQ